MAPKRKPDEPDAPPPKKEKGGAGRGQGRKPSLVNAKGKDSADGPKHKQLGLEALLGKRTKTSPSPTVCGGGVQSSRLIKVRAPV